MPLDIEGRRRATRAAIEQLGYSGELILEDYPVYTQEGISRCGYAAFGQAMPKDMNTATLVADVVESDARPDGLAARALATPFRLAAAPSALEVWTVSSDPGNEKVIECLEYEQGGVAWPGRLVSGLAPEVLLGAKREGRQLSLLPIDVSLLPTARGRLSATLTERVEEALGELLKGPAGRRKGALAWAARLVVGALTALMVRDKRAEAGESIAASAVLATAGSRFPKQFSWMTDLSPEDRIAILDLIGVLGSDVNYASLDPAIVSHVYEEAVVSEAVRARLGVHYTPLDLARRITDALPFEKFPPHERSVLDLACGSGTLLLAAHDRLGSLAPRALDAGGRHDYIRSHLTGYDIDGFAVQIAQLSLLLHALPEGNGWHIECRDALQSGTPDDEQFSVVMTNPPWRQQRSVDKQRKKGADDFVIAALDRVAPGGLLALILPATWLDSNVSRKARQALTERADVFEIWRLPDNTFGSASLAPCVVFAERQRSTGGRTLFRRVLGRGDWRTRFLVDGRADEQHLSALPRDGTGFLSGALGPGRGVAAGAEPLSTYAFVQQGPVPEPPVDAVGSRGGDHRWLREAEALPAFSHPDEEAIIPVRYPADFHRRIRDPTLFAAAKLLVSAKRSPANPWRVKVGYDLSGVIPRETLYMVVPRDRDDREMLWGLLAVLGSSMAACWVDTYAPTLSIPRRVLTSMPMPSEAAIRGLSDVGERVAEAAAGGDVPRVLTTELEERVSRAYGLDEVTRGHVVAQLAGFRAPEGRTRFDVDVAAPAGAASGYTQRFGATLKVDDASDRVRLWVPGVTPPEGEWQPLPTRFLGWLCRPEVTFDVRMQDDDLHGAAFAFQAKTYLGAEELAEKLRGGPRRQGLEAADE